LSPTDLGEIARTKSEDRMRAICARRHLDLAVTDVLIRRGNSDVLRRVAANRGAQLSEASFANLFALANKDAVMAEKLVQRSDLPQHLFHRMLPRASETTRQRLLTVAAPDVQNEIGRMLETIGRDIVTDEAASQSAHESHSDPTSTRRTHGTRSSQLCSGQEICRNDRCIVVSMRGAVRHGRAAHERVEPVLILCKAAGFEWPRVRAAAD
jgi:uncharacterized protein (DUF2336 family)